MDGKIRNLHHNNGYPECPICLSDLVESLIALSKDCSELEFIDNENARKRIWRGLKEHQELVKQFKERITTDIRIEIAKTNKGKKNDFDGNVNFFKGILD